MPIRGCMLTTDCSNINLKLKQINRRNSPIATIQTRRRSTLIRVWADHELIYSSTACEDAGAYIRPLLSTTSSLESHFGEMRSINNLPFTLAAYEGRMSNINTRRCHSTIRGNNAGSILEEDNIGVAGHITQTTSRQTQGIGRLHIPRRDEEEEEELEEREEEDDEETDETASAWEREAESALYGTSVTFLFC